MPVAVGLVSQHQTKLIGNHLPKATKQEGENIRAARPQGARLVGSRKQQNERAGIEGRQAAPPHMRGGEDVREGWGRIVVMMRDSRVEAWPPYPPLGPHTCKSPFLIVTTTESTLADANFIGNGIPHSIRPTAHSRSSASSVTRSTRISPPGESTATPPVSFRSTHAPRGCHHAGRARLPEPLAPAAGKTRPGPVGTTGPGGMAVAVSGRAKAALHGARGAGNEEVVVLVPELAEEVTRLSANFVVPSPRNARSVGAAEQPTTSARAAVAASRPRNPASTSGAPSELAGALAACATRSSKYPCSMNARRSSCARGCLNRRGKKNGCSRPSHRATSRCSARKSENRRNTRKCSQPTRTSRMYCTTPPRSKSQPLPPWSRK
eukprot:scaffold5491_cov117-Isochrysis_galbana.AAC.2